MKVSPCLLVVVFLVAIGSVEAIKTLTGTEVHKCIRCLCHAVSACYELKNCAKYSINYDYWFRAEHPTVDIDDDINENSYTKCMNDDNCILNTINNYTNRLEAGDCNCDGMFNCEDMLAIHYNRCDDPTTIPAWEKRKSLFRKCSGLAMNDPPANCVPQVV